MVRRSVPFSRRVRAMRGQLVLAGAWVTAALASAVLGFVQEDAGTAVAVAVVETFPVLAPESGRIASVAVTAGQAVVAGEVLASVEIPGLAQEIAGADADVLAEEQLLRTEPADRARRFARDLDDLRSQLLAARVGLESGRALLAGLEADLARRSAPGVALAAAELDAVRTQRDASRATVAAREVEIAALERSVAAAEARLGGSGAPVTAAVLSAQARRDALRARAEAATLRAYTDGVVGPALPSPGQWVTAGLPVATVTHPATEQAVAYLDVRHAQRIAPGSTVRVRPESGPAISAIVRTVGVNVQAVPLRQQHDPTVPEWGVPITLQVAGMALTPGEVLAVEF